MNSAPILAIQLCHFSNQGGQLVKNETLVSCTQSQPGQYLTVPITIEDEISFMNKYSLIDVYFCFVFLGIVVFLLLLFVFWFLIYLVI